MVSNFYASAIKYSVYPPFLNLKIRLLITLIKLKIMIKRRTNQINEEKIINVYIFLFIRFWNFDFSSLSSPGENSCGASGRLGIGPPSGIPSNVSS